MHVCVCLPTCMRVHLNVCTCVYVCDHTQYTEPTWLLLNVADVESEETTLLLETLLYAVSHTLIRHLEVTCKDTSQVETSQRTGQSLYSAAS
jgi:hypothetical protein